MASHSEAPRYPWAICHAVTKVFDITELMELSDSCRHVLVALIKKVDQYHGRSPIRARRETIAQEVGKSVETVYRALRELESRQYIEAREQQKNRFGKLTDSFIVFSEQLCRLLDLPSSPSVRNDRPYNQGISHYLNKQSKETSAKASPKPKKQREVKKSLPEDLTILAEQGLSLAAVYKLMGMATKAGKRLSEIVQYAQSHLTNYSHHRLFGYLVKLIQRNLDYSFINAQAREKRDTEIHAATVKLKAVELRGRTFALSSRDDVRYQVDRENPNFITVFVACGEKWKAQGSLSSSAEFVEGVESGKFVIAETITPDKWA